MTWWEAVGKPLAQAECGLLGQREVAGVGLRPLSLCPLSGLGTRDGLSGFLLGKE